MNTLTESDTAQCVEMCNKMLRGERSAVEAYDLAIERFETEPAVSQLRRIRDEHIRSVLELEANIVEMGGEPDEDAGAWGIFTKAVQITANFLGEESAIEALAQGEKKGLYDYQEATGEEWLMPYCRILYNRSLIPRIESHLRTLDMIEETVAQS